MWSYIPPLFDALIETPWKVTREVPNSVEKSGKGDPLGFLKFHCVAKIEKQMKEGPFGEHRKKSHKAEKREKS